MNGEDIEFPADAKMAGLHQLPLESNGRDL
jgi:hypothetical protein